MEQEERVNSVKADLSRWIDEKDTHWVYVLYAPVADAIKVGKSKTESGAQQRINTHQTSSPEQLQLLGTFRSDLYYTERQLHEFLSPWRKKGEWFHATSKCRERLRSLLSLDIPTAIDHDHEPLPEAYVPIMAGFVVNAEPFEVTFDLKLNPGNTRTGHLYAYYEINYECITDDYTVDEISARALYKKWRKYAVSKYAGQMSISWVVAGCCTFDPHPVSEPLMSTRDRYHEDWSTFFTDPVRTDGKPFNWLDLPAVRKEWCAQNPSLSGKGGFIQTLTGWNPASPTTTSISVAEIDAMIRLREDI
jgi:hypothetical protein